MLYTDDYSEGWDCDPTATFLDETDQRDESDDTGDWQDICLDRWGDRMVNGEY